MAQYVEVNGQTIEFPDGMAAPDIEKAITANYLNIKPAQPVAVKAGGMLNDVGRQVGLTARYGIEGLANLAQIGTEPIRYLQDKLTPDRAPSLSQLVTGEESPKSLPLGMIATQFADKIGLPSPQNANERVVGDAARMMVGAGGFAGGSQSAANALSGTAQKVFSYMAANPVSQITGAAGGGLAGGASREAGGTNGEQVLASVLGTVAGGLAPSGVNAVVQRVNAMRTTPMQLEGKINLALREGGIDFSQLPRGVRETLMADVRKASASGGDLNADALRRLADFRMTNTTPTRGMLTLDPVQITREQNLAKIGANTADEGLQGLARTQNQNNTRLIGNLDALGAADGSIEAAGRQVVNAITGRQAGLRSAEQAAWDAAKASPGYRQPISSGVLSDINRALDDQGLMPFMNEKINSYMGAFQSGQRPFTPQDYRNLQSMLSREVAKGSNEGAAAQLAQRILRDADVAPVQSTGPALTTARTAAGMRASDAADDAALSAIDQVNTARNATRQAYAYEDSTPLVRSVLSDSATSDPQRIAQRFIVGGTADEAATLAQEVGPQGAQAVKGAILAQLKDKATQGANNEVAKFSQSAFNRELRKIGERKLQLFFTPEEIAQLQANGRVASYMQAQPVGSAVNNSNSGALALGGIYDAMNTLAKYVPFGRQIVIDPLKSLDVSLAQRQAQIIAPSLLTPTPRQMAPSLLGPGVAAGGLLAAPRPERP